MLLFMPRKYQRKLFSIILSRMAQLCDDGSTQLKLENFKFEVIVQQLTKS